MPKKFKEISNEVTPEQKLAMLEALQLENQETEFLRRTGRVLAGLWEITKILFQMGEGKSLVIDRDGNMHIGKVNTSRLRLLPQRLPGRTSNDFDADGRQEFIHSKSWVNGGGATFKNAWDNHVLKAPRKAESSSYGLFMLLAEITPAESIRMNRRVSELNAEYIVVDILRNVDKEIAGKTTTIKEVAMSGYFSMKTGKLFFVEVDGEKFYA